MPTTTTRLALSKPLGTETVDIDVLNANSDKLDAAAGATICTSTTRPSTPYSGQVIYETDTTLYYVYSSGWKNINMASGPNLIINGGFDIWQRGTSSTADGYTSADRWNVGRGGATWGRGQNVAASGIGSSYTMQINAGTATNWILHHAIELATTGSALEFTDGQYTLSFWAYAPNGLTFTTEMYYADSVSGGAQSSPFVNQAHTGIGGWKRYSVTCTPSSVTPNSTNKCIRLAIYNLSSVGFSGFGITNVQFEKGSVATPFRRAGNTLQGELAACQRYFYNVTTADIVSAVSYATTAIYANVKLPVEMRATPSYTGNGGTAVITDNFAVNMTASSATVQGDIQLDNRALRIGIGGFSGLTVTRFYAGLPLSASGSWRMAVSAEL